MSCEERPELFALQPDGTRGGWPNPRTVKICQSNPAVWKQWLADVEEKLKQDPNLTVFSAAPNDGWYSGHCICENCTAWDHPDGEPRMFHWQDHRAERPALTDRHLTFANRLAELLRERYPDKDYYVLMNSYGHSRPAPVEARPAENVSISSVANFFGRTTLADRGESKTCSACPRTALIQLWMTVGWTFISSAIWETGTRSLRCLRTTTRPAEWLSLTTTCFSVRRKCSEKHNRAISKEAFQSVFARSCQ